MPQTTSRSSILVLFLSLFILLGCKPSAKVEADDKNSGRVVKIVDGDTYDLMLEGKQTRIRMEGIDAPERGMDFYKVSKNYLGELCMDQTIRLEIKEKDRYGRIIAKSYLPDGRELGEELVRKGLAWHYTQYNSDPTLAELEAEARAQKLGLWSLPNPTPPWQKRKDDRKKRN